MRFKLSKVIGLKKKRVVVGRRAILNVGSFGESGGLEQKAHLGSVLGPFSACGLHLHSSKPCE